MFYVYPAIQMFLVSLWTGNVEDGYEQTWNWGIYPEAITEYWPWLGRSIVYGGLATILAFALGFPLAYAIAFRGGAYKNLLLFLVIAPFFTSFLLRTISWKIILADNGLVLGPLKLAGILPEEFRLLATPAAVIFGITYNFLPFMTLPLYVALEKIDKRLIEAAQDLYAGPWRPQGTIAGADHRRRPGPGRRRGDGLRAVRRSVDPGALLGGAHRDVPDQPGVHPRHHPAGPAGHLRRVTADLHPGRR